MKRQDLRGKELANEEAERSINEKRRKEIIDGLPSGGTTGTITVKDGAGQAEATALAASAAFKLAERIAVGVQQGASAAADLSAAPPKDIACDKLRPLHGENDGSPIGKTSGEKRAVVPVLLISGIESLSFGRWDQFRFRACKIARDYEMALTQAQETAGELRNLLPREAGGSIAAAGTILSTAVKLAQLVTPDWEIAPLQTTVANRAVLLEVARAYRILEPDRSSRPLYWQGAVSKLGASSRIFEAVDVLGEANKSAVKTDGVLADLIGKGEKLKSKKPKPPAALEDKLKEARERKATLEVVVVSHAALLKDLYAGDAASPLPMGAVISEAAAASLLGNQGMVVSLNVDSTGGTSAARKVFWNAFDAGSPPLFITGTVGVSYAVVRASDQQMFGQGAYTCSTGPVKLRKVPAVVNPGGSLSCAATR
jgi:hypothetical protein